jgi:spore germination protein YaaH
MQRSAVKAVLILTILALSGCKSTSASRLGAGSSGTGLSAETEGEEESENEIEEVYEPLELPDDAGPIPENSFGEVWAYYVGGNEADLLSNRPISDLVYFAAEVDRYGNLAAGPKPSKTSRFRGRTHLAIICSSSGLTHFVIQKGSEARRQLIAEILAAVKDYDGLNIDMENVPARDGEHFTSFLRELREGLGGKILSVCVPGRTRAGGVYNYATMAGLVDRVFVMAYDEHWSGSEPGPVASMNWCRSVANFGLKTIGVEKLVMGIPFYGRSWGDKSTSRALIYNTTEWHRQEYDAQNFRRVNGVPTFIYDVNVRVTVYYEDVYSLATRMYMYRNQGIRNVGFWRLGQEPIDIWRYIKLDQIGNG